MKIKMASALVCGLAAVASGAASAADVGLSARVGPTVGSYKIKVSSGGASSSNNGTVYGAQTGVTLAAGDAFADFGLDLMKVNVKTPGTDFDRTDYTLLGGYNISSMFGAFAGYRLGQESDSFFKSESKKTGKWLEKGPFIGASIGGIEIGPVRMNGSLSYNINKLTATDPSTGRVKDFNYPGYSIKVGASLASLPAHSLQIRYQDFKGDLSGFSVEESYLQLIYLFRFTI